MGRETVDVPVGETDYQAVLRRVVLALVLNDQAVAARIIGLAFTATTPLRLVPLVVSLVLGKACGGHDDGGWRSLLAELG